MTDQAPTLMAYVGCRTTRERQARGEGIRLFAIEPSGTWCPRQTLGELSNPSFLALHPEHDILYAVHGDFSSVSALRVDRVSGELTVLETRETGGRNPVHLLAHSATRSLVVANYATGSVARLPLGEGGQLGELEQLVDLAGTTGPHRTQQEASHPHQVLIDPSGRRLIVPDKGRDRVFVLDVGSDGALALAPDQPPVGREGSGPRHGVFDPSGTRLFIANELDSTVSTFDYNPVDGRLTPRSIVSTLPTDCLTTSHAAGIALTPCGRWLYVSNRGDDSVTLLAVSPSGQAPRIVSWIKSGGMKPRFITLDPSGMKLLVANEDSDTIVIFMIESGTGRLSPTGQVIETSSPVCIVFR